MFLFKKKKSDLELRREDDALIRYNSESINVLIELVKNDKELNDEKLLSDLDQLKDDLKFLVASDLKEVMNFDEKIKVKISDFKVDLVQSSKSKEMVLQRITALRVLIKERNANIR